MSELTLEQMDVLEVVAEALSEASEKLTNLIDFPNDESPFSAVSTGEND